MKILALSMQEQDLTLTEYTAYSPQSVSKTDEVYSEQALLLSKLNPDAHSKQFPLPAPLQVKQEKWQVVQEPD